MAGEHITGARGAPPALHCAGNGVVPVHQPWPSVGQLMQMAGRNAAVHQGRASCSGPFERAILGSHASPVGLCLLPLGKRESWGRGNVRMQEEAPSFSNNYFFSIRAFYFHLGFLHVHVC